MPIHFTSVNISIFFVHSCYFVKKKPKSQKKKIYTSYFLGEWRDSFLSMDALRSLYSHEINVNAS